jgi:hypothetical protein
VPARACSPDECRIASGSQDDMLVADEASPPPLVCALAESGGRFVVAD